MAIQRWDPLRDLMDLRERVTRLFDEVLSRSDAEDMPSPASGGWTPPLDLFEEAGRYVLRADLPGVAAGEVDIQIQEGMLTLRGERRMDPGVAAESYLRVERPHGRFSVQVALPDSVERGGIKATHRNGVIEVVLPKKQVEAPSRIEVSTP